MTGSTVREETPDDMVVVRRVVSGAFGGEDVADLLDAVRESVAWLGLSFVAVETDGSVVGHVSYTRGWLDAPARLVEVLVLSPLSVRPDRQGAGVGTRLVIESLRRLRTRAEPLVFLEGDPGYYSRLGFVPGSSLRLTAPSARIPEGAFQVMPLPGFEPRWMHGALVYPDVWWRHDAVGLRSEG
ncbi:MAG TPA: N-acetyltransferase [Nocardioidaceae bacterium]|nr:N-acetyltransferase [Nocardioidaceae bacterium]